MVRAIVERPIPISKSGNNEAFSLIHSSNRLSQTKLSTVGPRSPVFVTTRWSVVLAAQEKASPDSAPALDTLCRAYWFPLYAYVRGSGHSPHDAQDL